jgi:hypothetical protein
MARRPYETLGRRILRLLSPESGGPRKRTVLIGVAGTEKRLKPVLARLIKAGSVVLRGRKRGTVYALGKS